MTGSPHPPFLTIPSVGVGVGVSVLTGLPCGAETPGVWTVTRWGMVCWCKKHQLDGAWGAACSRGVVLLSVGWCCSAWGLVPGARSDGCQADGALAGNSGGPWRLEGIATMPDGAMANVSHYAPRADSAGDPVDDRAPSWEGAKRIVHAADAT
jgi:hypothetical protein